MDQPFYESHLSTSPANINLHLHLHTIFDQDIPMDLDHRNQYLKKNHHSLDHQRIIHSVQIKYNLYHVVVYLSHNRYLYLQYHISQLVMDEY